MDEVLELGHYLRSWLLFPWKLRFELRYLYCVAGLDRRGSPCNLFRAVEVHGQQQIREISRSVAVCSCAFSELTAASCLCDLHTRIQGRVASIRLL